MSRFFFLGLLVLCIPGVCLGTDGQPNIIVINLDDADLDLLSPGTINSRFPNMGRLVTDGLFFSNLHVTTPICGPSRACLFRGQHAHRTGIRVNDSNNNNHNGFEGGMADYILRGNMEEDLSVWVKRAGYRTMLVGKYLNGGFVQGVPPGWDDYYASLGGAYFNTTRYTNRSHPKGRYEQLEPGVYRTAAEAEDAVALIQSHVDSGDSNPFFLYLAPFAPHAPAAAAVGGAVQEPYTRWWSKAVVPFARDRFEADFSDKTSVLKQLQPFNEHRTETANSIYRERLRTILSVDDMFGLLMDKLEATDLLDNTYIIVTSDNGYQLGHHRMIGKGNNYDRSTRVPLYVIGPDVVQGVQAGHLLAHIDITATVLELAKATATVPQDGKSFLPLLEDPASVDAPQWRDPVLIQNWESRMLDVNSAKKYYIVTSGLRFFDAVYTEWADGTSEYYDLAVDPYQLDNTYDDLPVLEQEGLRALLRQSKSEMVPDTSIAHPLFYNELISDQTVVTGLAEDNKGVASVKLTIRDVVTRQFWDGENWSDNYARVTANLKRPGQPISVWRYSKLPPANHTNRTIAIWARTYSDDREHDPLPASRIMRIAAVGPVGKILYPPKGETISGPFTARGNYGSDQDIQKVRVVLLRLSDQMYWNGTTWTSEWTAVQASLSPQQWKYEIDVAPGNYFISSRLHNSQAMQQIPAKSYFTITDH